MTIARTPANSIELYDAHTHVVPPFLLRPTDPRAAWDLPYRFSLSSEAGIKGEVLSLPPVLYGYDLDRSQAERHCLAVNDWLASLNLPGDSYVLGTVPMQHPKVAISCLRRAADAGLAGVSVGAYIGPDLATLPQWWPVFEAAEDLGLVVFVHANGPAPALPELSAPMRNATTVAGEMTLFCTSLLTEGLAARVRGLRLLISHGGGGIAMAAPRLENVWERDRQFQDVLPDGVLQTLQRFFYDSLVFGNAQLDLLARVVGSSQVVAGSDSPFLGRDTALAPILNAASTGLIAAEHVRDNYQRLTRPH